MRCSAWLAPVTTWNRPGSPRRTWSDPQAGAPRLIDRIYTDSPFFGSRKMAQEVEKVLRRAVNRKRVQRLMRLMGIEAVYPKPNLSKPAPGHLVYPYLLRGVTIERVDQVWSTDITYVALPTG